MSDEDGQRVKGFCARCKSRHDVTKHHILPKRFFKAATNITPFINLCRKCHDIIEQRLEKWELKRRFRGRFKTRKPLKPHEYFKVLETTVGLNYLKYVYTISCWNFKRYARLSDRQLPQPYWLCQNPMCGNTLIGFEHDSECPVCNRCSLKPVWFDRHLQPQFTQTGHEIIIKAFV